MAEKFIQANGVYYCLQQKQVVEKPAKPLKSIVFFSSTEEFNAYLQLDEGLAKWVKVMPHTLKIPVGRRTGKVTKLWAVDFVLYARDRTGQRILGNIVQRYKASSWYNSQNVQAKPTDTLFIEYKGIRDKSLAPTIAALLKTPTYKDKVVFCTKNDPFGVVIQEKTHYTIFPVLTIDYLLNGVT